MNISCRLLLLNCEIIITIFLIALSREHFRELIQILFGIFTKVERAFLSLTYNCTILSCQDSFSEKFIDIGSMVVIFDSQFLHLLFQLRAFSTIFMLFLQCLFLQGYYLIFKFADFTNFVLNLVLIVVNGSTLKFLFFLLA